MGILHLDIKPENILILPETRDFVKLFDMDSLIEKSCFTSDNPPAIYYSSKWEIPEIVGRRYYEISEATDLFCIGCILFTRVMKRDVSWEDFQYFAKWEFPKEINEDYEPRLQDILTQLFQKTLSTSTKHRFQSADEFLNVLEEAIRLVRAQSSYLCDNNPSPPKDIFGRKEKYAEIEQCFQNDAGIVVLSGIGGMGKTTVALQYAKQNSGDKQRYEHVVFFDYRKYNSIKSFIEDSVGTVKNCEYDPCRNFAAYWTFYKKMLSKNVLLIIDNFDVDLFDRNML